jgi:WD40 repeat protein
VSVAVDAMEAMAAVDARGASRALGAHVVAACFDRAGTQVAFGLGDGSVHIGPAEDNPDTDSTWFRIAAHDGAVMAMAPDTGRTGFLSAGDDGVLARLSPAGEAATLFSTGGKWIEQLCVFDDGKSGLIACGAGKSVHLFDRAGARLKTLAHPSTVTGLAFDARGKRLAASHYNGASVWFTASKSDTPRLLEWKGSHTGVAMHPAADAVVTAMQENALHGWRLADAQHMRMTGYPAKPESLGFTRSGKWLASGGADAIVLWPFFGGGPMGKPPLEVAQIEAVLCTRIACHPKEEVVAAGYADGTVLMVEIPSQKTVMLAQPAGSPVSALTWSGAGGRLAFGTEAGLAGIIQLAR